MLAPYSLLRTAGPETEAAAPPPRWLAMAVALGLGGATAVACAALAGGPAPPAALHASPLAGWRPLTVPGLARPAPAAPAAPAPAVQRSAAAQRPPVALRAGGRQAVTPAESLASFGLLLFGAFAAWAAALATFAAWRRSADRVGEWRALAMAEARAESPVEGRVAGTLDAGNCVQSTLALLRLGLADVELRWRKSRDPTLALYTLPERRVITGEPGIAVVASRLPAKYQALFQGWYAMYKVEAIRGGATEEEILAFFNRVVDRLILLNKEPYVFESVHRMIRQPFDYFKFGQDYTRYLIDWDRSYLRNLERWDDIAQAMKRGENAILLGNHQTEADAAFIPLLLESYNRNLGEMVFYVAGDRVVSDPMVQPFSMGRNLFCVHSKRHMDDDPRMSREEKQKMNRRTLVEMSKAFKRGGNIVWIAPHGGRDRRQASGEWGPGEFDPDAVELMRALGAKCGRKTWLYPLAMATHSILPPPETRASGDLGEQRVSNYTGVALSLGAPLSAGGEGWLPEGVETGSEQAKKLLTATVFAEVNAEYSLIKAVMKGFGDGTYVVPNGSQPWKAGQRSPYQL